MRTLRHFLSFFSYISLLLLSGLVGSSSAFAISYPLLEGAMGMDTQGELFYPDVQFSGGTAINGQSTYQTQISQKLTDTADVVGTIQVAPADVGKQADIFVFAVTTLEGFSEEYYFMLGANLYIDLWDQYTNTIVPFMPKVTLGEQESFTIYSGRFFYAGQLDVFFGYRLADGTFIYSNQPIIITIKSSSTEPDPNEPDIPTTDNDPINGISALTTYRFTGQESKTLVGTSTESASGFNCTGTVNSADQIGRLALVSLFYDNGCYTDGRYNNNNYLVDKGLVSSSTQQQFEAYRISPPTAKAQSFLASQHAIYYQFPSQVDYNVYRLDSSGLNKVASVSAANIQLNQWTPIKTLIVSELSEAVTYVMIPASQNISAYPSIATGIEAAHLATTSLGTPFKYRYSLNGFPFDTKTDFPYSPNQWQNIYAQPRQFFWVSRSDGQKGVIWQDKNSNNVQVTWLANDLRSYSTQALNTNGAMLVAATSDGNGSLYVLTIQTGDGSSNNSARTAMLYKFAESGMLSTMQTLDTSKTGLNIVSFNTDNVASLRYSQGLLGLIIGRKMHAGNDGLNHQGAIAVVFDANSLSLRKNFGQTSGHSFENILTVNAQAEFIGVDLGDNYPRGIHLHRFTDSRIDSRVVYTFKTEHGTSATNPAGNSYPFYASISDSTHPYYQWSNDNRVYTELGGVIEGQQGYTVVFAGEKSPTGVALDNSRVGNYLNDPRNIGLVQVVKDFANVSTTDNNVVPDGLVTTNGLTETGGFYTFNGTWAAQRNTGIVWLTDYQDKTTANVSRLKSLKLNDGNILLLWELWTNSHYVNTYALKITEQGQKLSEITALGTEVRLQRTDDIWLNNNSVYIANGNKMEQKLEIIVLPLAN
ncbi:hypothetical protein BegalDRAFT_1905 [Beggiatoa alba B18LD]|uniref:Uncharacterized protein n=1 Tax=Beggiatoa alba B18LD TaxID=395493 RepID=I3CGN4_9GAMM|nr:hypothetical protein [Beggiatoa alba]EIJ42777.1 hypothetical protein BegalDRAFT_1905 [Beggiatoa alba B18LD]